MAAVPFFLLSHATLMQRAEHTHSHLLRIRGLGVRIPPGAPAFVGSSRYSGRLLQVMQRSMKGPSLEWFIGVILMFGVSSSCALFHRPIGHIQVKAVSWKLVKKYAEPGAGLVGHKITIIDPSNGQVVAEKSTDNLGYAIFDVPAGSYTVTGLGGEPQNVV